MNLFSFKNSHHRSLRYFDNLNKTGVPVLFFHGFPGSYEQGLFINSHQKNNIRFISFDRPGLGGSDYHSESSLLNLAKDIEELIDHLNLNQIYLLGISGGAPYAVATAFHLKSRVKRVSLICPLSPLIIPEVFAGMPKSTQTLFSIFKKYPTVANLILKTYRQLFLYQPEFFFERMIKTYPLEDRKVLHRQSELRSHLMSSFKTGFKQGVQGLNQDLKNYFEPLAYDLNHVLVPVDVWHGSKDTVVPYPVGEWYAKNIPKARFHLIENEGHFSLPYKWHKNIMDALLNQDQTSEDSFLKL